MGVVVSSVASDPNQAGFRLTKPFLSMCVCFQVTQTAMYSFTAGFTPLMAPKAVLLGAGIQKMSASAPSKKKVLATSEAKWDARYSHAVPHTTEYYLKCCFGGVLSCGLTHLAVTPLDVAKCNMQVRRPLLCCCIGRPKAHVACADWVLHITGGPCQVQEPSPHHQDHHG